MLQDSKKVFLIVGPNVNSSNINIEEMKNIADQNYYNLELYENCDHLLDSNDIKLSKNSRTIIFAHGRKKDGHHQIQLCNESYDTYKAINILAADKPINVELFSCYGSYAKNDIKLLPSYSTLITLQSDSAKSLMDLDYEIIKNSITSFNIESNPFTQFVSYIYSYPNSISFNFNINNVETTFSTNINSIVDHLKNAQMTKIWQDDQLENFLKFLQLCRQHKISQGDTPNKIIGEYLFSQLDSFIETFQNEAFRHKWTQNFDINRFKELLLIKMSHENNTDILTKLLESDLNVQATIIQSAVSPMFAATLGKSNEAIKLLHKAGHSLEMKNAEGYTPLLRAIEDNSLPTAKLLINLKADINAKIETDGRSALMIAAYKENFDAVKMLIENNAQLNIKDKKYGVTALDLAKDALNTRIIEILTKHDIQENFNQDYDKPSTSLSTIYSQNTNTLNEKAQKLTYVCNVYKNLPETPELAHKLYAMGHKVMEQAYQASNEADKKVLLEENQILIQRGQEIMVNNGHLDESSYTFTYKSICAGTIDEVQNPYDSV